MSKNIMPFNGVLPEIAPDAFIAPSADVIGRVTIGEKSSIWFNCVVRGDVYTIDIGKRSNIQDGTVIHVSGGTHPTKIGDDVLVGHNCLIHGCTLEDGSFVGMGTIILDGVVVESGAMVAAGAMVTPGKRQMPPQTVRRGTGHPHRRGGPLCRNGPDLPQGAWNGQQRGLTDTLHALCAAATVFFAARIGFRLDLYVAARRILDWFELAF